MIRAEHKLWARLIFIPYIYRLLRKHFSNIYLVNEPPQVPENNGLIITPNHFSWWDGFFIDFVMRRYSNRKLHIMMLEEQLKRFWFFRKLGAYSIDVNNKQSISESLQYTREIISDPAHFVVYYPQGEIQPYDKRPLKLKPGLKRVLQNISRPVSVVPAAFRIQYGDQRKPDVYARFTGPLPGETVVNEFNLYESEFCNNINELDRAAHNLNSLSFRHIFGDTEEK